MFSLVSFGDCVFKGICFILAVEFFDMKFLLIAPCFDFNISRIFSDGHLSFLILVTCIFSFTLKQSTEVYEFYFFSNHLFLDLLIFFIFLSIELESISYIY